MLCIGMLLFCSLETAISINDPEKHNDHFTEGERNASCYYEDELDQEQLMQDYELPVGLFPINNATVYIQVAQSFIPTKEILTRVELFVGKNVTASCPYIVAIRENLTKENIVEISLHPDDFIVDNFSWLEFDFDDIWVDVGHIYYIVCYTQNVSDNWYVWAAVNDSESYPQGCAWVSFDGGNTWGNESYTENQDYLNSQGTLNYLDRDDNTSDMCFKTYGIQFTELEIDIINIGLGFSAIITNIGDATAWEVEWSIHSKCRGIFRLINITSEGDISELVAGDSFTISTGFFVGFGPIQTTVSVKALNAPEVSESSDGFLFFIFVILQ
jgi:hypothetical protein